MLFRSWAFVSGRGRALVTRLPKSIKFHAEECNFAIREPVDAIITALKRVLEDTPPELAGDIIDRGMVLTGGGAMIDGLPRLISERTGLHVYLAEDPVGCVALGTGMSLDFLHKMPKGEHIARRAL